MSELHQLIFFYVFLAILVAASIFTFMALAGKMPGISSRNLTIMLGSVVLAVVGAVVVFFKSLFDESNTDLTKKALLLGRYGENVSASSTPMQVLDSVEKRLSDLVVKESEFSKIVEIRSELDDYKARLRESREQLSSLQDRVIPLDRLPQQFRRQNTVDALAQMQSFLSNYEDQLPSPNMISQNDLNQILDAIRDHHAQSLTTLLNIRAHVNGLVQKVQPEKGTVQRLLIDDSFAVDEVQYTKHYLPFWNAPGSDIVLVYKDPNSDKELIVRGLKLVQQRSAAFSARGDYLMVNTSVMQRLLPPGVDAKKVGELQNVTFYIVPESETN